MSSSAVIEVALGLVFTYFIFSSFCSGINETIARVFNSRGTALFSSINALLGDAQLAAAFWSHPLIEGSIKARSKSGDVTAAKTALAGAVYTSTPTATSPIAKVLPSYVSASTFSSVLMDLTGAGAAAPGGVPAVGSLAAPESIASLIRIAQGDAQKLQKEIEDWFNATMDRLSGWYKRKAQMILLVLSVVTVVVFNINTIHIGEVLWSQPAQRATIAQQAGASGSTVSVKQALDAATSFPIGWSKPDRASTVGQWIMLLLGWIITIGALTLGAPFWFDLLTKLGSLRSTGPPPKPS